MKVKLHQHTGETSGRLRISQTLFLVDSSTPSLSHPCNLHSCNLIFYSANSSWVSFPLNNTCLPACLWLDLSGEELLSFILLVRRHQQGCRNADYNIRSFWNVWILLEKGGTRNGPGAQGSHEVARWAFTAAPRSSRSKLLGKSRQIFSGVM